MTADQRPPAIEPIVQEITIAAPAERIFDALTRPEAIVQWWSIPGRFHATRMECDLRPGGKWKMRVVGEGGQDVIVSGEYHTIERPHLLIFTWIRELEDATETIVRWDLEERDGVTRVRVTHSGFANDSIRRRNDGWRMLLPLLQRHAEAS